MNKCQTPHAETWMPRVKFRAMARFASARRHLAYCSTVASGNSVREWREIARRSPISFHSLSQRQLSQLAGWPRLPETAGAARPSKPSSKQGHTPQNPTGSVHQEKAQCQLSRQHHARSNPRGRCSPYSRACPSRSISRPRRLMRRFAPHWAMRVSSIGRRTPTRPRTTAIRGQRRICGSSRETLRSRQQRESP